MRLGRGRVDLDETDIGVLICPFSGLEVDLAKSKRQKFSKNYPLKVKGNIYRYYLSTFKNFFSQNF